MVQHINPKRRAIIFDLDGTLIDSAPDIASAVNRVMHDVGKSQLAVSYVEGFIGDGSRSMLDRIFKDHGLQLEYDVLTRRLADYMNYYAEEPASRTQFFDHVREDLQTLYASGFKLGVCTNKPHRLTGAVLDALGIADLFTSALGADANQVKRRKPDASHLLAVIEDMNEIQENALYVGDTEVDRAAAHNAGVPFFLVPWGGGRFLDAGGDTRIKRLADLAQLSMTVSKRTSVA